jgi:hypothetical protein
LREKCAAKKSGPHPFDVFPTVFGALVLAISRKIFENGG